MPPRLHQDEKLSAFANELGQTRPFALGDSFRENSRGPPPPQAVASEETAPSTAAVVASDGAVSTPSNGSGDSNTDSSDIAVAHRVQPVYSAASVQAREQGYVVAGLLIGEHGLFHKVPVVHSSGFRRLDQSVVDALRQWTFTRKDGAPPSRVWTKFTNGFHLATSNSVDLSSITLTLL